jgi:hypothetical protein
MKRTRSVSPRLLLNWVLCRGRQLLTCRVERTGDRYRVSALTPGESRRLFVKRFDAGLAAFQSHAALVADLRRAGWMSVAYR